MLEKTTTTSSTGLTVLSMANIPNTITTKIITYSETTSVSYLTNFVNLGLSRLLVNFDFKDLNIGNG